MGEKKKVLIVDDSQFLRNRLKEILEKNGFEVVGIAQNGLEALSQYEKLKPDLVTLDIIMPQINGLETLKKLRAVDPAAAIVIITSFSSQDSVKDCMQAGAKGYILKPFDEKKVVEAFQKASS